MKNSSGSLQIDFTMPQKEKILNILSICNGAFHKFDIIKNYGSPKVPSV